MGPKLLVTDGFLASISLFSAIDKGRVMDFIHAFRRDPSQPGLSLERLACGGGFWSARLGRDMRAILHKDGETWVALYAGRHDEAYAWAERRTAGRHPVTGALQIVEIVEVQTAPQPTAPARPAGLLDHHHDDYLLALGVPTAYLLRLREVSDEDALLSVCERLPADVADRLLSLAAGEWVAPPAPLAAEQPAREAAGASMAMLAVDDEDGLRRALEYPLERWISFLHYTQRELVERSYSGPVKVTGSAGTGKTVVAMHRARALSRRGERVLLTTYVGTLCQNLMANLVKLCTAEELARITVATVHAVALDIVRQRRPGVAMVLDDELTRMVEALRGRLAPMYTAAFLKSEWDGVVRAHGVRTRDGYLSAGRVGRGRRLGAADRRAVWPVFEALLAEMEETGRLDYAGLCEEAVRLLGEGRVAAPYTAVVVDEVQDLRPPELRLVAALGASHPGNLMVCGDAGQRIYAAGYRLSALGIDVRGRSTVLKVNYRTTAQIRTSADRVLATEVDDLDGGVEARKGTHCLLRGPEPVLQGYASDAEELAGAVEWIGDRIASGRSADELAVFARTGRLVDRVWRQLTDAGIPACRLTDQDPPAAAVRVGTMHRAKGLEFKVVLVFGCGDAELPNPRALQSATSQLDVREAETRERKLLYVAMTRARDELRISWHGRASRFLTAGS